MNRLLSKFGRLLKTRSQRIAAVLMLAVLAYVFYQAGQPRFEHYVTVLGTVGKKDHYQIYAVGTSRGYRVAYISEENGKYRLTVDDGLPGPWYDQIILGSNDPGFARDNRDKSFSPDRQHLAYLARTGNKMQVVWDGNPGPWFDKIDSFSLSNHLVYRAITGGQCQMVLDGQPGPFNDVDEAARLTDLEWSPDGRHSAYVLATDKQGWLFVDNVPQPPVDKSMQLHFGNDRLHLAYVSQQSSGQQVVWDGQPGPFFDQICPLPEGMGSPSLKFSDDGQHLAYLTSKKTGELQMVVDGKPGPEYAGVNEFYFSPDGRHWAYIGLDRGGKAQAVFDGVPGPWYDSIRFEYKSGGNYVPRTAFGQDGLTAYSAEIGGQSLVVVNGVPGPTYDEIDWVYFSPDGKHLMYEATQGAKQRVVVDGVPGPLFDQIGHDFDIDDHACFSAEGDHVIYTSSNNTKQYAVVDGVPGPAFDEVEYFCSPDQVGFSGPLQGLSPDGRHTAYFAQTQARTAWQVFTAWLKHLLGESSGDETYDWWLIVDGLPVQEFPGGAEPPVIFSPDSRHYAYVKYDEKDQDQVCVDNVPGPAFEGIAADPIWRADGQLEYLAIQKNGASDELVRVVVRALAPPSRSVWG